MKTRRKIVGKTRLDRIKNEDIRNQCQTQEVGEWTEKRRLEWAAHVSRMLICKEKSVRITEPFLSSADGIPSLSLFLQFLPPTDILGRPERPNFPACPRHNIQHQLQTNKIPDSPIAI
ncbi:hypothetical protein C0J52_08998 [Blattella germanica]|nr:hypothetical protein C0J52_08998 [Blattella germanica]